MNRHLRLIFPGKCVIIFFSERQIISNDFNNHRDMWPLI